MESRLVQACRLTFLQNQFQKQIFDRYTSPVQTPLEGENARLLLVF
jgi:hypothetical protein